jgi:hypothetical protein
VSGVRYTTTTRRRAIELREAGWSITRIARLLAREGHPVSENTVWCWVNEEAAERQRERKLHRNRQQRALTAEYRWPGARRSDEWLIGRIRHLRAAGLSATAIATLAKIDHDRDISVARVRELLREMP